MGQHAKDYGLTTARDTNKLIMCLAYQNVQYFKSQTGWFSNFKLKPLVPKYPEILCN